MELHDATSVRVTDHFRKDCKTLADEFEALRGALREPSTHRLIDHHAAVQDQNTTPKARLQHFMAHTLSGLLTLADSTPDQLPRLGTARDILALRMETESALRTAKLEFGHNTVPRDQIDRLDARLIGLYRDCEAMIAQAENKARSLADKRLGGGTRGQGKDFSRS